MAKITNIKNPDKDTLEKIRNKSLDLQGALEDFIDELESVLEDLEEPRKE